MKNLIAFFLLMYVTAPAAAFSLDSSDIRLHCPQRGQLEVILHRYEHTQEFWGKDHFETGAGHSRQGTLLIFTFANLDKMIFEQSTKVFSYWYEAKQIMVRCSLVSISNTYPVDVPYFRG